jgi:hydroxymethylbilane synthase
MPPAPGQGALAVQCRSGEEEVRRLLARLDRLEVRLALVAERAVLVATGGTCRSPVGALAEVGDGRLRLLAGAASPDGSAGHVLELEGGAGKAEAERLGREAAVRLLERVALGV